MRIVKNTTKQYGIVAIVLHWLMAAMIITLLALGIYMVQLPDVGFDTKKIILIIFHKELGILILPLVGFRIFWRIFNINPKMPDNIPIWQQVSARFVHLSFYGLMIAMPITGWLMSSAAGLTVSFFGLFNLPDFVSYNNYLFQLLIAVHKYLGYLFILLLLLHVAAALRHHFINRDNTLRKILW